MKMETEMGAISQGMLAATKDGDKRNGIFPRACGEMRACPNFDLDRWLPECKRRTFSYFKLFRLWKFIMAATRN